MLPLLFADLVSALQPSEGVIDLGALRAGARLLQQPSHVVLQLGDRRGGLGRMRGRRMDGTNFEIRVLSQCVCSGGHGCGRRQRDGDASRSLGLSLRIAPLGETSV